METKSTCLYKKFKTLIWRLKLIYYQLKTLLNPYFTKEMHLFACKSENNENICTFKNTITQDISFAIRIPWSAKVSSHSRAFNAAT